MKTTKEILILEFCNYENYPIGGYLTFSKHLMTVFGNNLRLAGITTSQNDPVGKWFQKTINGVTYDFFALARYNKSKTKHLLPDRLVMYFLLKFYKKRLLSKKTPNVFIQRHEILMSVKNFGFENICYRFAGVENPLHISKYWYSPLLARPFEKNFFETLKKVKIILAAGDNEAIEKMVKRSKKKIAVSDIIKFPTRINTEIFKPACKEEVRKILNIPENATVITTTGRLSTLKGWKFMIDCFARFLIRHPDSIFYMIGEGEDSEKIRHYISRHDLSSNVFLQGKKAADEIALYLNAADLFIMASYKEGWSTSLIEAVACGVPVCTTNFSSAKEIVTHGVTGYVVDDRDIETFNEKMEKALKLDKSNLPIASEIKNYAVSELKYDLIKNWQLI
jgi:glycosyltransferase involved in cell wall biosynthesis